MLLYSNTINDVVRQLGDSPINLTAAMAAGKSRALDRIRELLELDGHKPVLLSGRRFEQCVMALREYRSGAFPMALLIDDVDQLLAPPDKSNLQNLAAAVKILHDLVGDSAGYKERSVRLVVSTTGRFYDPLYPKPGFLRPRFDLPPELVDECSRLAVQFLKKRLDPWPAGWKQDWEERFDSAFDDDRIDHPLIAEWRQPVLEITGGHPALFGPVLDTLGKVLASLRQASLGVPSVYRRLFTGQIANRERLIRRYIENWMEDKNLPLLKSTIRRLRDSSEPGEQKAFADLLRIAAGEREVSPERAVRDILINDCGLLYEDFETGELTVPGEALREVIRVAGQGLRAVTVTPDPESDRRGTVIMSSAGRETRIPLTGRPWKLLEFLFKKQGTVVSVDVLTAATGMDLRAVQNGIVILRGKLKSTGIQLTNERDHGYRVVLP